MKTENNSVATHPVIFCIKKISQFCIGKLSPQIGPYLSVKKWSLFFKLKFREKAPWVCVFCRTDMVFWRTPTTGIFRMAWCWPCNPDIYKVNLRRFDGKFPHTLPLQKANRHLHENAAFQSTKSNTFQGGARPLGFEGAPFQPTATPQKIHFTR